MRALCVIACVLAAAVRYSDAQAKADGGYRGGSPRDCDLDWSYRDVNGQITQATTGCLSLTAFPPYNAESPQFQPSDPRTDKNQWCSFKRNKLISQNPGTNPNAIYDITNTDENRLTSWGFCLLEGGSNSSVPSAPPTLPADDFYADGGYATSVTPCDENWNYRVDGVDEQTGVTGCLDGDEYPPYGWGTAELSDPSNPTTDTTKWCSIKSTTLGGNTNYEVNPGQDEDFAKRKAWGFCFNAAIQTQSPTVRTTTAAPVTESPTDSGVTESPAPGPQTATPTFGSSTTVAPTTISPTTSSGDPNAVAPSSLSSGEIAAAVIVPFLVVIAAGGGFAYYKYHNINKGQSSQPQENPTKSEGKPVSDPEEGRTGQEILHN